jgi:N-acetylneuraminate synthase
MAHAFIDAIANAGADAVKFQTHIAAEESTPGEPWRVKFSLQDLSRYEYWRRMEFTVEQWLGLKKHADERGILFLSTPFSEAAVDLLQSIDMKVWKIGSGEVGNLPLLRKICAYGHPVILSSGMSDLAELDSAVELVKQSGNPAAVLQCTSAYPCPPESIGLNVLGEFRTRYGLPVGLSDHSGQIFASLAAVSLGAEVVEVHVTLSREMFGPDVPASITSSELRLLVDGVRQIEKMLDSPIDKDSAANGFTDLRKAFTKSVVAGSNLAAGTILAPEHLKLKKPGIGLPPNEIEKLLGKVLLRDVKADELLQYADVGGNRDGADAAASK